ncbi:response regulator [Candidatus Saccharibacteria bacterium]|nr:response regulator [Candidatus Saccharibacteria bacterium]
MIAIIEDDRGWEDYYRQLLADYDLRCFHDGLAAVRWMDETLPDVIILDILLTGPTGFAVLNELQSYPELARVPVIVVSSVQLSPQELVKYGVVAVYDKSEMMPAELQKSVQAALEGARDGKKAA